MLDRREVYTQLCNERHKQKAVPVFDLGSHVNTFAGGGLQPGTAYQRAVEEKKGGSRLGFDRREGLKREKRAL